MFLRKKRKADMPFEALIEAYDELVTRALDAATGETEHSRYEYRFCRLEFDDDHLVIRWPAAGETSVTEVSIALPLEIVKEQ